MKVDALKAIAGHCEDFLTFLAIASVARGCPELVDGLLSGPFREFVDQCGSWKVKITIGMGQMRSFEVFGDVHHPDELVVIISRFGTGFDGVLTVRQWTAEFTDGITTVHKDFHESGFKDGGVMPNGDFLEGFTNLNRSHMEKCETELISSLAGCCDLAGLLAWDQF